MNNIENKLSDLVQAIAKLAEVQAIGLSGGKRPLPDPGDGDIDLFVYCLQVPNPQERYGILESLGFADNKLKIYNEYMPHWGVPDSFHMAGVETWVMYFTISETLDELQSILQGEYLDRSDPDYYPIGRLAMFKDMRTLHDPKGVLASIQKQVAVYPKELARAISDYHLEALADTEDLDRATQRGDVLFYHFALDRALDHFLQALFALNMTYFPSRKRTLEYIREFKIAPKNCGQRLKAIVTDSAQAGTLVRSRQAWEALVGDLKTQAGD